MVSNVKYEEEYIVNDRELKLFTCRWVPEDQKPKALVFLCHGYAMESSISMQGTGTRLAKAGYGVYGIDYVGHGKSDGLHGYIPSFEQLVEDCSNHFTKVCEREENKGKQRYLMGESMGGAVLLLLHRLKPDFWDGAVLVAPMCKLTEALKPNALVISVLKRVANIVPTWRLIPTQDIIDAAVRDPEKKKEIRSNPYWYTGRPRLKTANELYDVSLDIESRLHEVKLPFLIVHGGDDKITDPAISKLLHETASSSDKTFKLYPGMWHALTYGELPENIDIVFKDIIQWLDERSKMEDSRIEESRMEDSRLERERKSLEDKDVSIEKPMSPQSSI